MAVSIVSIAGNPSDDPTFRLYANGIHTAILAVGWLQTADAGQINFVTVSKPGAGATVAGFAVYKMNDTLQATAPIFLKVSYGSGNTAVNTKTTFQLASSTDNAGTLTGGSISAAASITGASVWSGSQTCYVSGSSNRLSISLWPSIASQAGFCVIERDLDANGAVTALGMNIVSVQATSSAVAVSQFIPFPGPAGPTEVKINALLSSQTSQTASLITDVAVVRTSDGLLRNPMIGLLACARADFTTEALSSVSLYGTTHTYLSLTTGVLGTTLVGNSASYGFLMQFE